MNQKIWAGLIFASLLILTVACSDSTSLKTDPNRDQEQVAESSSKENDTGSSVNVLVSNPPKMEDLDAKDDPLSESIKRGYSYFNETNTTLDQYVGSQLSCTSCHAGAGVGGASSLVGITAVSPEYNPRADKILTIEDRINGCMIRSMNGEKLPLDSPELRDMVSYLTYISKGIPVGADLPWRALNNMNPNDLPETDLAKGEELYAQSCASCHGENGEGTGANIGPAVWGEHSFNDGAGIARLSKATKYIQRNMPIGQEETLTLQQSADVAAYILSKERPQFANRANDWPNGGAPIDAPYYNELKSVQAGK